ncbi:MAG: hypothetical protein KF894_22690 [Labilithrix sp.]|nr:hypothetical protein [Labilithrix sp.]
MQLRHGLFYFLAALSTVGCTVTSSEPGAGAPAAEIGRCKSSCDKMKFFQCSSAAEQAACYADCDTASASQIEVFTGCAESSICDPACRTSIQPAERAQEGGGGASAATCETACSKLVTCSLIPVGAKARCHAECSTKGYQYQIDCVNSTACGDIASTCGGESSTVVIEGGGDHEGGGGKGGDDAKIAACFEECDSINFFDCAPVALHGECRDRCTSASATKRDAFTACSKSSGVKCENKAGCLDAFLN